MAGWPAARPAPAPGSVQSVRLPQIMSGLLHGRRRPGLTGPGPLPVRLPAACRFRRGEPELHWPPNRPSALNRPFGNHALAFAKQGRAGCRKNLPGRCECSRSTRNCTGQRSRCRARTEPVATSPPRRRLATLGNGAGMNFTGADRVTQLHPSSAVRGYRCGSSYAKHNQRDDGQAASTRRGSW